jgi:formate dehydrogenase major subunit
MNISRRGFLKSSALVAVPGVMAGGLGFDLAGAQERARELRISSAREVRTLCPYCAVGCGAIAYVQDSAGPRPNSALIHVEGDPDHPINRGALCPKGATQLQLAVNPRLGSSPLLREPGSDSWTEVSWDFALDRLARRFKDSRDATFVERDSQDRTVNRCEGIAWMGGAAGANEDAYLMAKAIRAQGLIYIDHQARI